MLPSRKRLPLSLVLLTLALASTSARAQAGIYGMFSASHYSGVNVGNGTTPGTSGGITPLGGTFGFYQNMRTPGPLKLGADIRGIVENSANSTPYGNKLSGLLVGGRVAGDLPLFPATPYAQVEIGVIAQNNGTSYNKDANFGYQFQFGGDFALIIPHLKGRAEYGVGQVKTGNNTSHTLQTFGIGLVVTLP